MIRPTAFLLAVGLPVLASAQSAAPADTVPEFCSVGVLTTKSPFAFTSPEFTSPPEVLNV